MKRIYLLVLLLFSVSGLSSQPWLKSLPLDKTKSQLTLKHYKDAFYNYWAPFKVENGYYDLNGVKTKASGWKQFKRWEYDMERQVNPTTGEFPKRTAYEIYKEYINSNSQLKSGSLTNSSNWSCLGPFDSGGGYSGVGRTNCVAFHPTDNNTWWVGSASGGLWVTTNNGSTWTCLTDQTGILTVSDIAIPPDYATSKTIYLATGEKNGIADHSIGVLKSTDGGSTWNTTGIIFQAADWDGVSRILVDPLNTNTVIAATTRGVYKTTDGGVNWGTQLSDVNFFNLEYKPGDFNTLYGSTRNGSIYISQNGGISWALIFADSNAQRLELAVSPNQPSLVYAVAANSSGGLYGIYKSLNSGSSFTQVFSGGSKNLLGGNADGSGTTGNDISISASPINENILLIGGINTWRSLDGGASWSIVNHWTGNTVQAVHADKNMLNYRKDGTIFECNDGGVYNSIDNGTVWSDKTNGMAISQIYRLGVSNLVTGETILGLQDNGSKLLSGGFWKDFIGGDGMECVIDYTNSNIQYGSYQGGGIFRTTNRWNNYSSISSNISGGQSGAWVTPYIIDPVNPKILYAGYSDVWKTLDRGDSWTKISTMNTPNKIQSMAISPSNPKVLYVADPLVIWKTADNGASWSNITGTLPVNQGIITYIAVKYDDENTLWVTFGYYSATKVFQSVNGGASWTDISAGLPAIPAYSIVQNRQSTGEVQLYVGTELGIYFKKGSDNWTLFNTGLPNVRIGEIEIYYADNPKESKLRAATYGRGLWESPVYNTSVPMSYFSSTTTQNNITDVSKNQVNQEIIGVQVETNGDLSPLNATSFTFNTSGSTNPATDISNAKLYYTGSVNSFATTSQYGATSVSPNGLFTISGAQSLNPGTNYFWLTYDVRSTAGAGDVLDAQCTSVTAGIPKSPTETNPYGYRQIPLDIPIPLNYCAAGATDITTGYISRVRFGTIDQSSFWGTNGYEDFTSKAATMTIGETSSIQIDRSSPNYAYDELLIWIDWNRDGVFDDTTEKVYSYSFSLLSYLTSITPPFGAAIGTTKMRIRLQNNFFSPNSTPCGNSAWGEVEDYAIYVSSGCSSTTPPTPGTITQPTCTEATGSVILHSLPATQDWTLTRTPGGVTTAGTGVTSTITGLTPGTYTFTLTDALGCISPASAEVVINSHPVTPAAPTGTASQIFCSGDSPTIANLTATGTGILWYASPTAVAPLSPSTPLVDATTYYATQTQNGCESTLRLNVTATVNTAPGAPVIGTITHPTCKLATGSVVINGLPLTGTWTLTRSPGALTTNGTGATATITSLATGTYTYKVTNALGCVSVASANMVINAQPLTPGAPTGTVTQSFCSGTSPTIANLSATGAGILWYASATGGTPLALITPLANATSYYATQTQNTCESTERLMVTVKINPDPAAPTVGTITQPTCTLATGSVILNGLPPAGNWTLTSTPGAATNGTGISSTLAGLETGTFTYKVTDDLGCISASSANVVINVQPPTPPTPVITLNLNTLHSSSGSGNQWYTATGALAGEINQDYTPKIVGDYYVIVTMNGCPSLQSITNVVTGFDPLDYTKKITVYPNPVSDDLIIEYPGNFVEVKFRIVNSIGQVMVEGKLLDKTTVRTASFTPGLYFIKFDLGKTLEFRKVIKN